MKRITLIALTGLSVSCGEDGASTSDKEPASQTEDKSEPSAADEAEGDGPAVADEAEPEPEEEPAEEVGPCPEATEFVVAGTNREEKYADIDGPLDLALSIVDVSFGTTAQFMFTTYEVEAHPYRGISIPAGVPTVPEGGTIFMFRVDANESLALGTYTREDSDSGKITHKSAYHQDTRLNPLGDITIELTEVTDTHICGTVTSVGETELQQFPTISGRFKAPVKD